MRYFLLILGLCLTATQSYAAIIGDPCPNKFGKTELSNDQVNIVACLKTSPTDSTLIWKSMSIANVTCETGKAITAITGGVPTCVDSSTTTTEHTYKCPVVVNGQIVPGTYNGVTVWTTYSNSTCNGQTSKTPISCSYAFSFNASDGNHTGIQPRDCP